MSILDFDKALVLAGVENGWDTHAYRAELERQAQAAVQQEWERVGLVLFEERAMHGGVVAAARAYQIAHEAYEAALEEEVTDETTESDEFSICARMTEAADTLNAACRNLLEVALPEAK